MIKNKKSQITVFIIIGVILLFSTALVLYIKSQVKVVEREVKVPIEYVPTEMQPIQMFVTECLSKTAMDAFDIIGAHGGYISVDNAEYSGIKFEKNDEKPTEADVVAFPPKTKNYVPYWEFMMPPDNCEICYLGSYRPPLYRTEGSNSIESQIDKYIQNNIRSCLGNFERFRNEGYSITERGGMKATTFIRENDILINLNYSIEVSKTGIEKIIMSQYQATLPLRFKKIYDIAKNIVDVSAKSRFLGLTTLNLIAGFSKVDEKSLPPFSALTFTYNSVTWSKEKVKNLIMQMLEVYVQAIQMEGTGNFISPKRFKDPIMQGLYSEMVLPGKEVTDLTVNFMYLGWPIYLNFVGSNSDTLKPSNLEMPVLNLLPFRDYRFVYDISYPVIVRISDPNAYNGRGYTFVFAMEANVRNNDAVGNGSITLPAITTEVSSVSEFCKEIHRNSGIITVKTIDAETKLPLEGVNVVFKASQQCSMGVTKIDSNIRSSNYGDAVLSAKFPVGLGTLIISKPGYQTIYERFGTAVGKEQELSFALVPVKQISATVAKKKIVGAGILGFAEELAPDEIVMISIEKIKENPDEEPLASSIAYGIGINESQNVTIVPGKYKVTETFILNRTVTIPEEEECEGGFAGIGEKCEKLPELKFEMYVFPTVEFKWDVKEEELFGANSVKFFVIYSDTPKKHKDLKKINDNFEAFENNLNYLQYEPKIIK